MRRSILFFFFFPPTLRKRPKIKMNLFGMRTDKLFKTIRNKTFKILSQR